MRSRTMGTLAACAVVALGCGGLGAPVRPQLDPFCATATTQLPPGVTLASVDLPGAAPAGVDAVAVTADGITRYGQPLERAVDDPVGLYVDAAAPVERVIEALAAAPRGSLIVRSRDPWNLPPYAAPAVAEEVGAKLAASDPAERAMVLAREFTDALALCPGAQDVFGAVAAVDPAARCTILAQGLEEALPACVLTDRSRVVTLVQLASTPTDPQMPATLRFDPAAPPLVVDAGTKWSVVAPLLAAHPASALTLR